MDKAEMIRNTEVDYNSNDSDITEEGVIIRLREGKIVGLTILNASKRTPQVTSKAKAKA